MSVSVDQVFIKQFEADVHLAYQQMGTKPVLLAHPPLSKKLDAAPQVQNHVTVSFPL